MLFRNPCHSAQWFSKQRMYWNGIYLVLKHLLTHTIFHSVTGLTIEFIETNANNTKCHRCFYSTIRLWIAAQWEKTLLTFTIEKVTLGAVIKSNTHLWISYLISMRTMFWRSGSSKVTVPSCHLPVPSGGSRWGTCPCPCPSCRGWSCTWPWCPGGPASGWTPPGRPRRWRAHWRVGWTLRQPPERGRHTHTHTLSKTDWHSQMYYLHTSTMAKKEKERNEERTRKTSKCRTMN